MSGRILKITGAAMQQHQTVTPAASVWLALPRTMVCEMWINLFVESNQLSFTPTRSLIKSLVLFTFGRPQGDPLEYRQQGVKHFSTWKHLIRFKSNAARLYIISFHISYPIHIVIIRSCVIEHKLLSLWIERLRERVRVHINKLVARITGYLNK